ncbi:hypothetical protein [Aromatoleum bremense]|uniref:Uncharacterized protein n=1 Tax=Aromatoleum bremense TaxID=76115 RepID=A0ABX1NT09_9RHOO|nr:hypothetical protein [Aromatoleum bremense]NMG15149.1 hypothetical protein [Aromatoleum bremense]QTQ31521.1 Uncharacterized protein pbN1_15300 [Aromatoleum bremense]
MNRRLDDATVHLSAAAPYSRPGLRRRFSALRAGLKAALRALRASNIKR